jgi:pilus assembly protein Flp/PilA
LNNYNFHTQFYVRGTNCVYFIKPGAMGWVMEGCNMRKVLARFLKNETGATAIEYGLIAAGISVAIITVVLGVGTNLNTTFGSISTALK